MSKMSMQLNKQKPQFTLIVSNTNECKYVKFEKNVT